MHFSRVYCIITQATDTHTHKINIKEISRLYVIPNKTSCVFHRAMIRGWDH